MKQTEKEIKEKLVDLLNECLEGGYQDHSFEVKKVDLENMKFTVEFDIVVDEENNDVSFAGY